MTHRERIQALLDGKVLDRPAYSAWGHVMNLTDLHAADFARATIDLQNTHDFDFIKVMSNPYYMIEDMGLILRRPQDFLTPTARDSSRLPIRTPGDWKTVPFPESDKGSLAREKEAIRRIVDHFKGEVPVLASIFTPITWVQYLGIPEKLLDEAWYASGSCAPAVEKYLTENEEILLPVLDRFQELNIRYMEELLDMGVDGFFYAIEYADDVWSSDAIFDRFIKKYDMEALAAVKDRAFFTMLHACGDHNVRLDRLADYPVNAINWNDSAEENPSLSDAVKVIGKMLPIGGLDHRTDLKGSDREAIHNRILAKMKKALSDTEGHLILSGGCAWTVEDTYRFGLWRDTMEEL